tara:strand:+ start:204 stop:929 length:726 start_codon:yes stop_codon:yes gene_type:complete
MTSSVPKSPKYCSRRKKDFGYKKPDTFCITNENLVCSPATVGSTPIAYTYSNGSAVSMTDEELIIDTTERINPTYQYIHIPAVSTGILRINSVRFLVKESDQSDEIKVVIYKLNSGVNIGNVSDYNDSTKLAEGSITTASNPVNVAFYDITLDKSLDLLATEHYFIGLLVSGGKIGFKGLSDLLLPPNKVKQNYQYLYYVANTANTLTDTMDNTFIQRSVANPANPGIGKVFYFLLYYHNI